MTVCVLNVVLTLPLLPLLLARLHLRLDSVLVLVQLMRGARQNKRRRRRRATRPCASSFLMEGAPRLPPSSENVAGSEPALPEGASEEESEPALPESSGAVARVRSAASTSIGVVNRQADDRRVVTITIIFQIKVVRREGHSVGADVVIIIIGR